MPGVIGRRFAAALLFVAPLAASHAAPAETRTPTPAPTVIRQFVPGPGGYAGIAAASWRKIVNRRAESVRMEIVKVSSRAQLAAYTGASAAERRTMILILAPVDAAAAPAGGLAWPKPVSRPLALMTFAPNAGIGIFTTDAAVRTIHDLAGKRVDFRLPGTPSHSLLKPLFEAAGIFGKIERIPSPSLAASWRRLEDGAVDAVFADMIDMRFLPPGAAAVVRKRRIHLVDIPAELFAAARAATGLPIHANTAKRGVFRKAHKLDYDIVRADGTAAVMGDSGYYAAPGMTEDIAYELVKLAIEHVTDFGDDHAGGKFLPGRLGLLGSPQAEFHPGAARAFREMRWSFGREGIAAFRKAGN